MKALTQLLLSHIRGASGLTNAMLAGHLDSELKKLTCPQIQQLVAICQAEKDRCQDDEDVARTAEWLIAELACY